MPLAMARPMKRPTSSLIQFRQRIPADVLQKARGCRLAIPLGDEVVCLTVSPTAETVQFSLRTRDPREAKARNGIAAAHLERVWQGLREGPGRLSERNVTALAGELYAALTGAFEDDPGPPGRWAEVRKVNEAVQRGDYSLGAVFHIGDDAGRRRVDMEARFGRFVDGQLARRALRVDNETRARLLEAVGRAMDEAAARMQQNAEGDYSPDEKAKRFPEWREPAPATPPPPAFTFKVLVDGWWAETQGGLALSTFEGYSATAAKLAAFLGHDDAGRVTEDDVIRFKDHRLASINPRNGKRISARTVKENDLAGLKSLFGWAVRNRKLPLNPAARITLKVPPKPQTRSKGLTVAEAVAILRAANGPLGAAVRPKMKAACRWVPWLLAYTGARLGEMVQLRGQDVRQVEGVWTLNITPEAGTVKSKKARVVALHPHLVEMGFPDFAKQSGPEHLFITVKAGKWVGSWRTTKNRIGELASGAIGGADVAPNHGWRHRFKTLARNAGSEEALHDHITAMNRRQWGAATATIRLPSRPRPSPDCHATRSSEPLRPATYPLATIPRGAGRAL